MTRQKIMAQHLATARSRLGMTQRQFSAYFKCPLATLQRWEQGRHVSNAARWLIKLAEIEVAKHERAARQNDPAQLEGGVQPS